MSVETVKMSSKGQVVIPQDIREGLHAGEGTVFAVVGSRDTVVLKKIKTPSRDDLIRELGVIARRGKKRLQAKGIDESDIPEIVEKCRRK